MEQTSTQTNTPPTEPVSLRPQDTRKPSPSPTASAAAAAAAAASSSATSSTSPSTSSSNPSAAKASHNPSRQPSDVDMHHYVEDVRASNDHGCVTPSQNQLTSQHNRQLPSQQPSTISSSSSSSFSTSSFSANSSSDESSSSTTATTTLTNSTFNTTVIHNTTTIFKPFDSQTGQFVKPSNASTSKPSPPITTNTPVPPHQKHLDYRPLASLKASSRNKFRSHSVPTILHSSLRRIGLPSQQYPHHRQNNTDCNSNNRNHAHPQQQQQQQQQQHHHQHHHHHQQLPYGINKKKKTSKANNHHSLRHAILMNHRLQSSHNGQISIDDRIKYIRSYPGPMPLPPINLQCLREIDLQEIVKNPQLRHDIIFDPLLQFRPNLDGERGAKKRQISDKYWSDVENEIIVYMQRPQVFQYDHTRLVPLFNTLKEVLLTIVPQKEAHTVQNILDSELIVQELLKGSLVMSNLSEWLAQLFKHHCAPMRDAWVDKMSKKFKEAEEEKSVSKLADGLRLVFQILEAMKLDIANHQIRILRPALLSNAVEFEKQYFQSLMASNRVDLKSSLKWFNTKFEESCRQRLIKTDRLRAPEVYRLCIRSIISLLSCRKMVREYPTSLSFDHARLVLLRADIRQIVCLLVCRLLFKQLVANDTSMDKWCKDYVMSAYTNRRLKAEIVSIITDEHGNCRWTKNTMSIAVHLCKTINDLKLQFQKNKTGATLSALSRSSTLSGPEPPSSAATHATPLDSSKIDFAKSWLSKQTQPLSEVYGVLEARVFKSLEESIFTKSGCTQDGYVKQDFIHLCSAPPNTTSANASGANLANTAGNTVVAPTPTGDPCASAVGRTLPALSNLMSTVSRPASPTIPGDNFTKENTTQGVTAVPSLPASNNAFVSFDFEEFESLYRHLYTVINFHWSVFGCHYVDSLGDKMEKTI